MVSMSNPLLSLSKATRLTSTGSIIADESTLSLHSITTYNTARGAETHVLQPQATGSKDFKGGQEVILAMQLRLLLLPQ
jgi:hypothetical protein